ncbi:glycosyltransferase family 4 protein [Halobacillus sp. BAB-2008]|uniref:glycosyltransferase family 4 protein n=1 Tax=Halobacillus sp. BAB-2008 TaxID=1246484 RepID=UPI0002A4CF0A|nr:glycosyltransferase family 4 protein [Halobacillus sp. BAB-2008]ELK48578.1 WecB/TagA/CpsF family glycosyl transferase [Halobacillus sp. BAB-2008]
MKVLHIVRQYRPAVGGLENFVSELAAHLNENGVEVEVLTLDRNFSDHTPLPPYSIENGIQVRRIPYFGSKRYPIAPSTLKYVSQFDLIHIHAVDAFIDLMAVLKPFHRKPIILSTHGGFFHTKKQQRLKHYYFHTITRMIMKKVNKVVACSNNDFDLFRKITPDNLKLIENGINVEKYSRISDRRGTRNHLITVGRFSSNKRVDLLLELIHRLKGEFQDVKLSIVGKDFDHLRPEYEALIDRYDIQEHVEIIEDATDKELLDAMSASEYFISASEYEGFGLSALEAMAAGRIPLLSDIPSFNKMIDEEKNGHIIDFQDMDAAADKVSSILRQADKERLIHSSMAYANGYSWDEVVKDFQSVYEEVCCT